MNLKILLKLFKEYCSNNNYEINESQVKILEDLIKFLNQKKSFWKKFNKEQVKLCFYLYGDVGVGKTMLLNFIYKKLDLNKKKIHFNEFMINFHNFRHKNKRNPIEKFVKKMKKDIEIIYLDEFQVTNIVDAMILGKLFENIFNEKIKVLITSNTQIEDLYKDGLQREQFIPFIKILKKFSSEKELILEDDYRRLGKDKLKRFFHPLNDKTKFKINQLFRKYTKNKISQKKKIKTKGRTFTIEIFFDGIARFNFSDLCDVNIGAEDYVNISNNCKFIVIENIPKFDDYNINQQQRFITLIDILYDKKIPLMVSSLSNLDEIGSSLFLKTTFKRTISRLYELTSSKKI